jgi:hypothetical protein
MLPIAAGEKLGLGKNGFFEVQKKLPPKCSSYFLPGKKRVWDAEVALQEPSPTQYFVNLLWC